MSVAESEPSEPALAEHEPFVESEGEETKMAYDGGGVPIYVWGPWLVFLVLYGVYFFFYAGADLAKWGVP